MTDMTKTELAAIIGGMTASQIKKASHTDLMNRAAHAQGKLTEMNAFGEDPDATPKAADKPAKPAKAAKTSRKPGADVILFLPADAQKEPRDGTKRAAIIDLLRQPSGASVEEIAAATGWSRSVAQSGLYVDVRGSGWGVERRDGRLFLLPQEVK